MTNREIDNLIIKANKLGARGIQVIGYIPPTDATQTTGAFITKTPEPQNATESDWYDE